MQLSENQPFNFATSEVQRLFLHINHEIYEIFLNIKFNILAKNNMGIFARRKS